MGINLSAKGKYLKSKGEDYKRIQTIKRTLLRKIKLKETKNLKEEMKKLKQQLITVVRERDEALKKVRFLTDHMNSLYCPPQKKIKL